MVYRLQTFANLARQKVNYATFESLLQRTLAYFLEIRLCIPKNLTSFFSSLNFNILFSKKDFPRRSLFHENIFQKKVRQLQLQTIHDNLLQKSIYFQNVIKILCFKKN